MALKPVVLRAKAEHDIEDAITHYLDENAPKAALGLIDALERAYRHLSRNPASGSSRYAQELNLPSLRAWLLRQYPYLVFYVENTDHIDVWRILHGARDIPTWIQEPNVG